MRKLADGIRRLWNRLAAGRWLSVLVVAAASFAMGGLLHTNVAREAPVEEGSAPTASCAPFEVVGATRFIQLPTFIAPTDYGEVRANSAGFCSCLSDSAREASAIWSIVLSVLVIGGSIAILVGGLLGPQRDAPSGSLRAQRGVLMTGLGTLALVIASYANVRAQAASRVAGAAQLALLSDDAARMKACVALKADWMSSRIEAAELLNNASGNRQGGT